MADDALTSIPRSSQATNAPTGAGVTGRTAALPVHDTAAGTIITAEIPAVPSVASYGVLLPDGTVWYPGSTRRLPAPFILRMAVWIVAFAVLIAGVGDLVIKYHPSWVGVFRHVVAAGDASLTGTGGTGPTTNTSKTGSTLGSGGVRLVSPQPAGLAAQKTTEYSISANSYTVQVTAKLHAAWVEMTPVSASGQTVGQARQQTLQAGQSLTVSSTTDLNVFIGAFGTTLTVFEGSKAIGTVPTPTQAPWHVLLVRAAG